MNENDIPFLTTMIEHADDEMARRYYRAKLAKIQGDYALATELFVEQARHHPIAINYQLAGECFLLMKQYPEAILYLAAATGLGEKQQRALFLLAMAQDESGNQRDAQTNLERVLRVEPMHKKARALLEKVNQVLGDEMEESEKQ